MNAEKRMNDFNFIHSFFLYIFKQVKNHINYLNNYPNKYLYNKLIINILYIIFCAYNYNSYQ